MGEQELEAQLDVIAELCVNPPSKEIRDCLRLYDPSHNTKQLKVDLNKCRKQTIVSTLDYLGIDNYDKYTKPACINMLVCRIQNLFPDTCIICEETYCTKLSETPLLTCGICGQGSHNRCILEKLSVPVPEQDSCTADQILKMCNPANIPGFVYLCGVCTSSTIPSKSQGLIKQKPAAAVDSSLDVSSSLSQMMASGDAEDEPEPEPSIHDGTTPERGQHDPPPSQLATRICPHYRKGTCRHGSSGKNCPNLHPKPCRKLLKHGTKGPLGCKQGRQNCEQFHPKMCPSSIGKGECTNMDCKLRHVTGTKRHKESVANTGIDEVKEGEKRKEKRNPQKLPSVQQPTTFLEALRLLKEEMLDAMDQKLAGIKLQTSQSPRPTNPPATTANSQAQIPWPWWNPMMYQMQVPHCNTRPPIPMQMGMPNV